MVHTQWSTLVQYKAKNMTTRKGPLWTRLDLSIYDSLDEAVAAVLSARSPANTLCGG